MTNIPDSTACPRDDIAAFVDGELSAAAASEFEAHISECWTCARVLREQRQFLASLSASLSEDPGIGLPTNFARRVIAAAESRVTGLRSTHEQFTAVFISAALLFFSMFALGSGFGEIVAGSAAFAEKLLTVALFSARAAANVLAAATVVVRSLFAASASWLYFAAFTVVLLSAAAVLRQIARSAHISAKNS
ncbi:MAG: zf-HC2 domain-containing protein [Chloracidobacterium sp.]|nr:zf-HC2 domain-containing protein [Chloracidobacterium sp.]